MALTEADPLCTTTLRLAKGRIWPAGQALGLRVGDVHILSSSPESFLHITPDLRVTARPILCQIVPGC